MKKFFSNSGVDEDEDEDEIVRKMAHRATMKRRPTIALALISSSSEEAIDFSNEEEEGADEIGELDQR